MLRGLEHHRGKLAPSLKLPTGQFFNARPGSSPDRATKRTAEAVFLLRWKGACPDNTNEVSIRQGEACPDSWNEVKAYREALPAP